MRIISTPVKELQIQCPNCKSVIGYFPFEVEKEWPSCPWEDSIVGYIETIKCPMCKEIIILKNEVY